MTITDPVLNISMSDPSEILSGPPSIILYGTQASGKSTEGAKGFQNLLWLCSNPRTLRPYASWIRDNPKEAEEKNYKIPAFKFIPAYESDGKTKVDNRVRLREIIWRYCESVQKGTCPYAGIALDEYSEFAKRVYESIQSDPIFGKNSFAKIAALKEWNSWICSIPRITVQTMLLICHESEPKYDMDEGSKTFGQMKYKGGPALPIGTEINSMAAEADICLRIQVSNGGGLSGPSSKRTYMTEANQLWVAKFRDFSAKPTEELGLNALLSRAGYHI